MVLNFGTMKKKTCIRIATLKKDTIKIKLGRLNKIEFHQFKEVFFTLIG